MTGLHFQTLSERALVRVSGRDAREFLQNIVTNDLDLLDANQSLYAALLTPQGTFLHDFILVSEGENILIDTDQHRLDDLLKKLALYRLRSDAKLETIEECDVIAGFGEGAAKAANLHPKAGSTRRMDQGPVLMDPRNPDLGVRTYLSDRQGDKFLRAAGFTPTDNDSYERLRISLGVPDAERDLVIGRSFLLESNFDLLNGVSFTKGCYIGQENTARQRYRGTVRRRVVRVAVSGPVPEPGTPVSFGKRDAGTMRSGIDGEGLALLRLPVAREALDSGGPLTCGEAELRVLAPLPEPPSPTD